MNYPRVYDEKFTMFLAASGDNLSRFGDGELRLALGGSAISQRGDAKLRSELLDILDGRTKSLPCIPPYRVDSPRAKFWTKYWTGAFTHLYNSRVYGSSWVTRADSAPWIDAADYWDQVAALWRYRRVMLVTGGDNLIKPILDKEAGSVEYITVPKRDAYSMVDELETICLQFTGDTILLACGATATVLAHRLAGKKHAVDIGHMSMFLTVKGAYTMNLDELASPYYRDQLDEAHRVKKWGTGGYSHVPMAADFAKLIGAASVLDYGCGRGTFKTTATEQKLPFSVIEYDPGIPGKDVLPKPADMVVCTDVLEHVEPELVDNVLRHIYAIGRKGAYMVIARNASNKVLPDGRNSHLIQEGVDYWKPKLEALGYRDLRIEDGRKHITVWATK